MTSLGLSNLDNKTKIGISVSLAVVVVLVVMGCAIGVLDCRKGYRRRQDRRQDRNAELVMLESEMRSGQAAHTRSRKSGLWDGLRNGGNDRASESGPSSVQTSSVIKGNSSEQLEKLEEVHHQGKV
ncbi:hypothetical protein CC80DRAFT_498470 [Byssothecium circinans]|uniref:Uncharacterized protein n=1 Tax=Byssothecium circinans TaxID=147558 RepID=A0A6A5UEC3_9PLEO|nr:hypothetical protein CC80DRAFT_498470 [Byssothecium circinans]